MTIGARQALLLALGDFYRQSWRLLVLNATLAITAVSVVLVAAYFRAALAAIILLGPLGAALMHCAVTLVTTDELRLREAVSGLRLHWRRGIQLGGFGAALSLLGAGAVGFYLRLPGPGLLAAFGTVYLLLVAGLFLLLLLAATVSEPELRLREAAARTATLLVSRPRPALGLGLALVVVNVAGAAAALMPFLTLTVAYSFLAAARFVIPKEHTA